jgi:hypothetical protein
MTSHEYALLDGFNRAKIGRYLAIVSSLVSAAIVFLFLQAVDVAKRYGLPVHLTPSVMSLIGAATVYLALYWLFNRHVWQLRPVRSVLRVPNLAGRWHCDGTSFTDEPGSQRTERVWQGEVTIAQSWDRLRIRLRTGQSASSSIVAAIRADEAGGYRLFYNYENDPRIDQLHELSRHLGFADMHVADDQLSADGEYFTGRGRTRYGRMIWSRQ